MGSPRLRFILPILFLGWAAWGLYAAHPSISAGWFYDDLHLVRVYAPDELRSTWLGRWDVDGIETDGYRPLTTYFNHGRAVVFGENVVLHRVLMIGLFAACLVVLALIAAEFGVPYWQSFLAGLFTISHQHNWYNLVWISDGVHALNTLLGLLSMMMLLGCLGKPSVWRAGLALICALAGLLVREDTLALLMVSVVVGGAYVWIKQGEDQLRWRVLVMYWLALMGVVIGYFSIRAMVVPEASALVMDVPDQIVSWGRMISRSLSPFGQMGLARIGDAPARLVMPALLIALMVGASSTRDRVITGLFLVCVVIAASVGLKNTRTNLLLGATAFLSIAVVVALVSFGKRSRVAAGVAAAIYLAMIGVATGRSMLAQEMVHPTSLSYLYFNGEFLFGKYAYATIPEERRAAAIEAYARYGISDAADFERLYPQMEAEALAAGREHPSDDGTPFLPLIYTNGTQRMPPP